MKRKLVGLMMVCTLLVGTLTACGNSGDDTTSTTGTGGAIDVVSREDGSGTRDSFVKIVGIEDESGNDATAASAEITNSTSVMLTTVTGDERAVGYVSLGSLSADVKAVAYNGAEATVDNINNGSYTLVRPFNLVYKDGSLSNLAQDFLAYVLSTDGEKLITDEGYVSIEGSGKAYTASGLSGKLTLAGSTSVSPLIEKLVDAYKELNPDVTVEVQETGSSAGITSAEEGVCDLGMSSRELEGDEVSALKSTLIAKDGIVVIVNKANTVSDLSTDQVKDIFMGNITDWSGVASK